MDKLNLKLLPLSSVLPIEGKDPERVIRLSKSIAEEGVLRNPLLVSYNKNIDKFILLDGTNRFTSLLDSGATAVPVQVIDYDNPLIKLKSWHHYLENIDRLLEILLNSFNFNRLNIDETKQPLSELNYSLGLIHDNSFYYLDSNEKDLLMITSCFELYDGLFSYTRIADGNFLRLEDSSHLKIVYKSFDKSELVQFSESNIKTPAGITRHIFDVRVLNLNIDIGLLFSKIPFVHKETLFDERVSKALKNYRFYEESTLVCFD